jgi:glutamine cyclotransferase
VLAFRPDIRFVTLVVLVGCGGASLETDAAPASLDAPEPTTDAPAVDAAAPSVPVLYTADVVATYPHDPEAFTQGLELVDGRLLESTGLYGQSSIRIVELTTGEVIEQRAVSAAYFAEGLTVLDGRAFQLTWESGRAFVYDAATLDVLGERTYTGEGWGLTHDAGALVMSDGTNVVRILDPETFAVTRRVTVLDGGRPVRNLNELEMVEGELFANVWMTDRVARIDLASGRVTGWIDLPFLREQVRVTDRDAVLNGIAYDAASRRLFVTGKLWPTLFEIRVRPAS